VLLYNVALTVQEGKPCSDNDLWKEFDKFFWEEVINKYFRGIVCVFMGVQCHKSANYLLPMVHYPFTISHPASASYNNTTWDSGGIWLKIDKILEQNNGVKIKWYKRKGEDEENYPEWVTKSMYQKSQVNEDEVLSDLPWSKKK
jgi:uracil DNA glycosylase